MQTAKRILLNNKMIAQFMELTIITDDISWFDTNFNPLKKYHESWSDLMPVVEKIEEFDNGYTKVCITDESCQISTQKNTINDPLYFEIEATSESKLKSTYKAVVKFIEWFNQA